MSEKLKKHCLETLKVNGANYTYFIKNCLLSRGVNCKTSQVLRALKKLEVDGLVDSTKYGLGYHWVLTGDGRNKVNGGDL